MPRPSGGEVVDVGFDNERPKGRPPTLSSGRSTLRAQSPQPERSKFSSSRPGVGLSAESPIRSSSKAITGSRPTTAVSSKDFREGQKVKMKRPNNQPGYADGTILRKNVDGTYVVRYDGDQIERAVKAIHITVPKDAVSIDESKTNDPSADIYFVGEKVEAPFKGSSKAYSGKVIVDNKDGTYAIKFDDGDEDPRVPESKIKRTGDPNLAMKVNATGASSHSYRMGEKIEARYNGGMTWLPGMVISVDRDTGHCDIRYDNGREEKTVDAKYIRARTDLSSSRQPGTSDSDSDMPSFSLNDKIEARHRGGPKWYAGRICHVNNDGSYNIRYADGEEESKVPGRFIRTVPGNDIGTRPSTGARRY
jgi:galactitol-specific phosphotransferase system IIB component